MLHSAPNDGFRLAYTDTRPDAAPGEALVLLLHGWPGDHTDYRAILPLLDPSWRVIVPDLRGFGESDRHLLDPDRYYSPAAHASALATLLDELGAGSTVIGGYDIGSRIAQLMARSDPHRIRGLVLAPPLPGGGSRILAPEIVAETWYLQFQRSPLAVPLLDGNADAVARYIRYFWDRWSGPGFDTDTPEMRALLARYGRPGAFEAAINWYRAGQGYVADTVAAVPPAAEDRLRTPTQVVWQDVDRLYPRAWSDALPDHFTDATLHPVDGVGHFVPLEAPCAFAAALSTAIRSTAGSIRASGDAAS